MSAHGARAQYCEQCGDSPPTETADGRLMCRSCGATRDGSGR